jgi:hypothetical protein
MWIFQYGVAHEESFLNSSLFAAIVGAVFVIIGVVLAARITSRAEERKARHSFQAWLHAVLAELRHITKTIDHLLDETPKFDAKGMASAERMNSDLLEKARLAIFEYDSDDRLLESLTTFYRFVVHTNTMLNLWTLKQTGLQIVTNALNATKSAAEILKADVNRKICQPK